MSESPAFQMYVNDFLGSAKVGMMSTEEIGAYLLLLFLDWQEGGFEYDPRRLAKWCRLSPAAFRRAWEQVSKCFVEHDGRLWSPRLEKERAKQAAWRVKAAEGAAKTNAKRWGKDRSSDRSSDNPPVAPRGEDDRIPFPSPSPTQETASSPPPAPFDAVDSLCATLPLQSRPAWAAEIATAVHGMHGKPLTPEQVDRACQDYLAQAKFDDGGMMLDPNMNHFRGFLRRAAQPAVRPFSVSTGRPSKQDVGRQNLADAVARRAAEALTHGE